MRNVRTYVRIRTTSIQECEYAHAQESAREGRGGGTDSQRSAVSMAEAEIPGVVMNQEYRVKLGKSFMFPKENAFHTIKCKRTVNVLRLYLMHTVIDVFSSSPPCV